MDLSLRNVPDQIADQLRARAACHHRLLQEELMAILEASLGQPLKLTAAEVLTRVRASELHTPVESAKMVRRDKDV